MSGSDGSVDTIIAGGTVYDGLGSEGVVADVALIGDKIFAVGPDLRRHYEHAKVYDASGSVVAPGFIDIHTHSDLSILANREMLSSIQQGVTTECTGNCGISLGLIDGSLAAFQQEQTWLSREGITPDWKRMSEFMARLEDGGISTNFATLAGHGTIRKAVMEFAERAPDAGEIAAMRRIAAQAMEDGAQGLSTGLEYVPGTFAEADEIAAIAEEAHLAGGFYASHMRNEGDTLLEAVNETINIGERTGIPVQLSHHKAEGRANWGKTQQTLARMQAARDSGLDVMTDQYPYTAFMTGLTLILLPAWVRNGSPEDVIARLTDPETRARVEREVEEATPDYDAIKIGIARTTVDAQGLTLTQLGQRAGKSPAAAAIDLLITENGWVGAAHFALDENDVEAVLRDPHTMIGSDGVATKPDAPERPHPRSYGTFPRVLSRYVRERNVISLADAIRRMTSLPAKRLKLSDRGTLKAGYKADITIFRADGVHDVATFEEPHQYPVGIQYVFVNGALTVDHGVHTGARAGSVLRRS